jgi:hypothetical protein
MSMLSAAMVAATATMHPLVAAPDALLDRASVLSDIQTKVDWGKILSERYDGTYSHIKDHFLQRFANAMTNIHINTQCTHCVTTKTSPYLGLALLCDARFRFISIHIHTIVYVQGVYVAQPIMLFVVVLTAFEVII